VPRLIIFIVHQLLSSPYHSFTNDDDDDDDDEWIRWACELWLPSLVPLPFNIRNYDSSRHHRHRHRHHHIPTNLQRRIQLSCQQLFILFYTYFQKPTKPKDMTRNGEKEWVMLKFVLRCILCMNIPKYRWPYTLPQQWWIWQSESFHSLCIYTALIKACMKECKM